MRPGDEAVALLFLMEYDRRSWRHERFLDALYPGRLEARSTMVEAAGCSSGDE